MIEVGDLVRRVILRENNGMLKRYPTTSNFIITKRIDRDCIRGYNTPWEGSENPLICTLNQHEGGTITYDIITKGYIQRKNRNKIIEEICFS